MLNNKPTQGARNLNISHAAAAIVDRLLAI